jgi:hypothetical protein
MALGRRRVGGALCAQAARVGGRLDGPRVGAAPRGAVLPSWRRSSLDLGSCSWSVATVAGAAAETPPSAGTRRFCAAARVPAEDLSGAPAVHPLGALVPNRDEPVAIDGHDRVLGVLQQQLPDELALAHSEPSRRKPRTRPRRTEDTSVRETRSAHGGAHARFDQASRQRRIVLVPAVSRERAKAAGRQARRLGPAATGVASD